MKEMKRKKVWKEKYAFGEQEQDFAVRTMASELGVSEWFSVLLYNRGYHTAEEAERFLKLEQENFHDPYLLADMDRAVERIFRAVENHEKIYKSHTYSTACGEYGRYGFRGGRGRERGAGNLFYRIREGLHIRRGDCKQA